MIMEMGELWIYRRWTHISEWSYARQYYWVSLAKTFGWQIIFEKFQNSQWAHPLTKLNINKSCCMDSICVASHPQARMVSSNQDHYKVPLPK
jgi:hypothetical protein